MPIEKHPQVEHLAQILGLPYVHALGLRAGLRFLSEDHYPIGDLTSMSEAEIAQGIEWSGDPHSLVDAYVTAGLMAREAKGYRVPDWVDDDASWLPFSRWIRAVGQEESN